MSYRIRRNLEASLIDYLRAKLTSDGWTGIQVEKNLKQDKIQIPSIIINAQDIANQKIEIGSGRFLKFPTVIIRIFAENDGQRLDLADWIIEKLQDNISYYVYTITNGVVSAKVISGNIVILAIKRDEKELANTEPSILEKEDRFRHIISFSCHVGEL